MALSAEQILEELRALPPAERLRVVEQVVHEVAREVKLAPPVVHTRLIWADETDAEFDAFQKPNRLVICGSEITAGGLFGVKGRCYTPPERTCMSSAWCT